MNARVFVQLNPPLPLISVNLLRQLVRGNIIKFQGNFENRFDFYAMVLARVEEEESVWVFWPETSLARLKAKLDATSPEVLMGPACDVPASGKWGLASMENVEWVANYRASTDAPTVTLPPPPSPPEKLPLRKILIKPPPE